MGTLDNVDKRIFREFLRELGLTQTIKGGHEKWNYPSSPKLKRPVVFQTHGSKTLSAEHLQSNLATLNVSKKEFLAWYQANKKRQHRP